MPDIGHNRPSLDIQAILDSYDIQIADLLDAVVSHWLDQQTALADLAISASAISSNKDRMPEAFDAGNIDRALQLYNAVLSHEAKVADIESGLPTALKAASKRLTTSLKPASAGISDLQEALRTKIASYLAKDLASQDADAQATGKNIFVATCGLRASITMADTGKVDDITKVPAEYLTIDPKKLAAAIKAKIAVPGITFQKTPALRIGAATDTD